MPAPAEERCSRSAPCSAACGVWQLTQPSFWTSVGTVPEHLVPRLVGASAPVVLVVAGGTERIVLVGRIDDEKVAVLVIMGVVTGGAFDKRDAVSDGKPGFFAPRLGHIVKFLYFNPVLHRNRVVVPQVLAEHGRFFGYGGAG